MNSPTITMEREHAVKTLERYEEARRKNPRACTETDRRIADGYKVLAKGGRLIDVSEALKAGGLNLAGIPKLAIARAHVHRTEWRAGLEFGYVDGAYTGWAHGGGRYEWGPRRTRIVDDRVQWSVPADTFDRTKVQTSRDFSALAPHIPLPHRPKFKLENYFLLWEANWHTLPRDPYLLRAITGALMEIVAEWDLTDLEIAAVRASTTNR
jgi:hypothetical protein